MKTEKLIESKNAANEAVLKELHDLLDLVDQNGRIHDLDKQDYDSLSTLGQTLFELMSRVEN